MVERNLLKGYAGKLRGVAERLFSVKNNLQWLFLFKINLTLAKLIL